MPAGGALIPFAEDHFSGGGLEDGGDRDVDGLADHLARIVDHDHGSVIEVGDSLVVLFAFFQDEDPHNFAGEDDGLEGVCEFVDVEDGDALQLGDFVEIEIVGDDFAFVKLGEFDELEVDFADAGKIVFDDLDLNGGGFLEALEDVETTASAIALEGVGGIGDELEFAKDELRDDDEAVEESGFGDVGDAAVDDNAGIENFKALLARLFASEDAAEGGQVEQIALVGADGQSDIGHDHHNHDLEETLNRTGRDAVANNEGEEIGTDDTENAADGCADQPLQTHHAQPPLEDNDGGADENTDGGIQVRGQVKRTNQRADDTDNDNK